MKTALLFIYLCIVTLNMVQSYPTGQEEMEIYQTDIEGVDHVRAKRATCDLASGFGVNHSLCASHCILLGKKGGYCNSKAVCVCRN